MASTLILLAALAVGGEPEHSPGLATAPAVTPQKKDVWLDGPELRQACDETIKKWAKVDLAKADLAEAELAAHEFLALHEQLLVDEKLVVSQRETLDRRVRGRLRTISDVLARKVARQERLADDAKKSEAAEKRREGSLAALTEPESLLIEPSTATGARGGMGVGNGANDHGQALVDLIRKTIAPNTWDVNGGPNSIYYWYPGRSLIVTAPDEVHNQLGGMLHQMRRMGN